jgi:hypothetical protein
VPNCSRVGNLAKSRVWGALPRLRLGESPLTVYYLTLSPLTGQFFAPHGLLAEVSPLARGLIRLMLRSLAQRTELMQRLKAELLVLRTLRHDVSRIRTLRHQLRVRKV